jgi:hypothetical protein
MNLPKPVTPSEAKGDLEKLPRPFDATKMPPNDSALFALRFTGVHGAAGLDQH